MSSYHYRHSHHKDTTVSRPSYPYNGNPHTCTDGLYIETGPGYINGVHQKYPEDTTQLLFVHSRNWLHFPTLYHLLRSWDPHKFSHMGDNSRLNSFFVQSQPLIRVGIHSPWKMFLLKFCSTSMVAQKKSSYAENVPSHNAMMHLLFRFQWHNGTVYNAHGIPVNRDKEAHTSFTSALGKYRDAPVEFQNDCLTNGLVVGIKVRQPIRYIQTTWCVTHDLVDYGSIVHFMGSEFL